MCLTAAWPLRISPFLLNYHVRNLGWRLIRAFQKLACLLPRVYTFVYLDKNGQESKQASFNGRQANFHSIFLRPSPQEIVNKKVLPITKRRRHDLHFCPIRKLGLKTGARIVLFNGWIQPLSLHQKKPGSGNKLLDFAEKLGRQKRHTLLAFVCVKTRWLG